MIHICHRQNLAECPQLPDFWLSVLYACLQYRVLDTNSTAELFYPMKLELRLLKLPKTTATTLSHKKVGSTLRYPKSLKL